MLLLAVWWNQIIDFPLNSKRHPAEKSSLFFLFFGYGHNSFWKFNRKSNGKNGPSQNSAEPRGVVVVWSINRGGGAAPPVDLSSLHLGRSSAASQQQQQQVCDGWNLME